LSEQESVNFLSKSLEDAADYIGAFVQPEFRIKAVRSLMRWQVSH
jgi:hypothetical protein